MLHKMPGKNRKEFSPIIPLLSAFLFVYFFDRASKYFAMKFLTAGATLPVIKNFLHLTLLSNTGGAFGIFQPMPWLFIIVAVIALISISVILLVGHKRLGLSEKCALVFMLAGILGNLTDRLLFGHVIDFIDFRIWPVFNIADCFITTGAGMLIIRMVATGYDGKGGSRCCRPRVNRR